MTDKKGEETEIIKTGPHRKSPEECVQIPDKILEFWPEVPFCPDKNRKIF